MPYIKYSKFLEVVKVIMNSHCKLQSSGSQLGSVVLSGAPWFSAGPSGSQQGSTSIGLKLRNLLWSIYERLAGVMLWGQFVIFIENLFLLLIGRKKIYFYFLQMFDSLLSIIFPGGICEIKSQSLWLRSQL